MYELIYKPDKQKHLLRAKVRTHLDKNSKAPDRIIKLTPNFALVARKNPFAPLDIKFADASELVIYGAVRILKPVVVDEINSRDRGMTEFPEGSLLLLNEQDKWFGFSYNDQYLLKNIFRAPIDEDDSHIDTSRAVSVTAPKGIQRAAVETWDDNGDMRAQGQDVQALRGLKLGE